MDVSVILCTAHRPDDLRQTLASLAQVRVPDGWACELLVVDNAPSNDTAQVVHNAALPSFTVRYVPEARCGKCFAHNTGQAQAAGRVLLWADDDVRLPANWLEDMARPILTGQADAVAGGVRIAPHLERFWAAPGHPARLASTERVSAKTADPSVSPAAPPDLVGANMAFGRHVLEKVPMFDTELGPGKLGAGEETLFSWQLKEAGFRVTAAAVSVEHHFNPNRLTRGSLLMAARKVGRSQGYILWHWQHQRIVLPRVRLAGARMRLGLWRVRHWSALFKQDRISASEMDYVRAVALLRQYLAEQKRPRRYTRRGLKTIDFTV